MPPVQTNYGFMSAARIGQIAEWNQGETLISRTVEGAPIGFGQPVLQGALDYGVKIADASGSPFRGVTVRTQAMDANVAALGPFNQGAWAVGDDCRIMTKGVVWVLAAGPVTAGQAAYCNTALSGRGIIGFGSSSESVAANGTVTFTANPTAGSSVTFNGTAVTFVASGASGNQVNIGANATATVAALLTLLQGSSDTQLVKFTYALDTSGLVLTATAAASGTGGNALTMATTVPGSTVSGATLAGGGTTTIAIPNGIFDTSAAAQALVKLRLG